MSEPTRPLLSVRGDARQAVAPDYVAPSREKAERRLKECEERLEQFTKWAYTYRGES